MLIQSLIDSTNIKKQLPSKEAKIQTKNIRKSKDHSRPPSTLPSRRLHPTPSRWRGCRAHRGGASASRGRGPAADAWHDSPGGVGGGMCFCGFFGNIIHSAFVEI